MRVDWLKLGSVLAVVVSSTVVGVVALATHSIDAVLAWTALSNLWALLLGYLLGNGKLARAGEASQPLIAPRAEE